LLILELVRTSTFKKNKKGGRWSVADFTRVRNERFFFSGTLVVGFVEALGNPS
jgi:hypothetical protein